MERNFEIDSEKNMLPLEYFLEDIEVEVDLKRKLKEEKLEFIGDTESSLKDLEIIKVSEEPKEDRDKISIEKKKSKIFENISPEPPYFYTLVNEKTFIKGVILYNSLYKRQQKFHMWIVCTDAITYSVLCRMKLEKCTPVLVSELGEYDFLEAERQAYRDKYYNRLQSLAGEYISEKYGINDLELCEPEFFYLSGYQYGMNILGPDDVIMEDKFLKRKENNEIYLKGKRIDIFKFTGFQIFNEEEFDLLSNGNIPENSSVIKDIYLPYIREVKETIGEIKQRGMLKTDIFYSNDETKRAGNYYSLKGGVR